MIEALVVIAFVGLVFAVAVAITDKYDSDDLGDDK